jgi:hypothetical protein
MPQHPQPPFVIPTGKLLRDATSHPRPCPLPTSQATLTPPTSPLPSCLCGSAEMACWRRSRSLACAHLPRDMASSLSAAGTTTSDVACSAFTGNTGHLKYSADLLMCHSPCSDLTSKGSVWSQAAAASRTWCRRRTRRRCGWCLTGASCGCYSCRPLPRPCGWCSCWPLPQLMHNSEHVIYDIPSTFMWFPIHNIKVNIPSYGVIYFNVSVVKKHLSLAVFDVPLSCTRRRLFSPPKNPPNPTADAGPDRHGCPNSNVAASASGTGPVGEEDISIEALARHVQEHMTLSSNPAATSSWRCSSSASSATPPTHRYWTTPTSHPRYSLRCASTPTCCSSPSSAHPGDHPPRPPGEHLAGCIHHRVLFIMNRFY